MKAGAVVCLVAVLASPTLAVEPGLVAVGSTTESVTLDPSFEILRDPGGKLTLSDVTGEPYATRFVPSAQDIVNFGFTNDVIWYRVELRSVATYREDSWVLELGYPLLDEIDVHLIPNDGWGHRFTYLSGDQRPTAEGQLDSRNFAFPVEVNPGRGAMLYLRVHGTQSHQGPFILWSERAFAKKTGKENLLFGMYYAGAITMIALNGIIALGVRDPSLVYYLFWIASLGVLHLVLNGFGREFLWSESPTWTNMVTSIALGSAQFWGVIFSQAFLDTRSFPAIDRLLKVSLGFGAVSLVSSFFLPVSWSLPFATLSSIYVGTTVVVAGVFAARCGIRSAWLFTASVTPTIAAIWLKGAELFGIAPTTFLSTYGMQLSEVSGAFFLTVAVGRRITLERLEKFEARNDALRNLQQYRQIFENAVEGMFQTSMDGAFVSANPAIARLLGYDSPQALIAHVRNVRTDVIVDSNEAAAVIRKMRGEEWVKDYELEVRRKDGTKLWIALSARTIRDVDGTERGFEGMISDVTERREQEQLRRERESAEAATRAKSEFLARMSHEIRTPMNAIVGFTDLALRTDSEARRVEHLRHIDTASHSLLAIINDILDISKIEAGKLTLESREFELGPLLDKLSALFSRMAVDKDLEIIVSTAPDVPELLRGDPLRLEQVLVNLLGNALKFTEQGEIELRVSLDAAENGTRVVRFAVRDTGIGVPPDQLSRLFAPFTQVDQSTTRRFAGTGLGLAISKQLAEMMGGSIDVESKQGRGSTFTLVARFGAVTRRAAARRALPQVRGLEVLLVDDNPSALQVYAEMLESIQLKPTTVDSATRALERLRGHRYDLVLMDWKMPGMDGLRAAREIRSDPRYAKLPIVLMTAYGRDEVAEAGRDSRIDAFLAKPIRPSLLLDTILEVLEPSVHAAPAATTAAPGVASRDPEAKLRGLKVLLVEDNALNRRLACELLADAGIVFDVAENGEEAVAQVERATYQAVLMDVQMPVMDGYAATRSIRKNAAHASLPIIAMTANARDEDRAECLASGMNDVVTKPIDVAVLLGALMRWTTPRAEPEAIDFAGALKRLGDREPLLLELLADFAVEQAGSVDEIRARLHCGDKQEAIRLAHSLKGNAANLGVVQVFECAKALEAALKNGGAAGDSRALLADLERALGVALQSIRKLPAERGNQSSQT